MKNSKILLNEKDMERTIARMAKSIVADGQKDVALVGILRRGVPIAERLAAAIEKLQGKTVSVGTLDINLYRDDLTEVHHQPQVRKTDLPFSVDGRGVILVDDVLYTGRTIRAAMDALIDYGRPLFIRLAVIIDRGWREFPIQADYVGKSVKTTRNNVVHVHLSDTDGANEVIMKG